MTKSIAFLCAALVSGFAILALTSPDYAQAQTATNLKCKGCVGKKDLRKKSVNARKLGKGAKPAGVAYVFEPSTGIDASDTIAASVRLKAPEKGYVIVTFSAFLEFDSGANTVDCEVTTATTIDPMRHVRVSGQFGTNTARSPIGQTRTFPVS
jgi:hypothetical protein